jgi:general stress protein 26
MTETEEIRRFLDRSMVVRVATISGKGRPHLTPLWFVRKGGHLYLGTRRASAAARDLAENPRVVMLFDGERGPTRDRILRLTGKALVRDRVSLSMIFRSALKYHLSLGGLRNLLASIGTVGKRLRYYAERGGEGCMIEVEPEAFEFLPAPQ